MAETKVKKSFPKAVGVSGNRGLYGTADTGEYLSKLDGYVSRAVFDKMRRNDAQIKSTLLGITLPIRQADYYMDAASDSPQDKEIAEKIDIMRNKMTMTWDDTIRHILLQFVYGFMVMEKVYRYDDNMQLVVPEKLAPRMPTSIDEWKYDKEKGKLLGPKQIDELGKEVILPIEKILVFTTDREGDNWEGISLLRAMYGAWYIKQRLLKIDAIKHDRHGTGIPVMTVPEGIKEGSDEWKNAEETVEKVHACEKAGIVLPTGYLFEIKTVENNGGTDVIPSLQYQDAQISRAGFQMFTNLGQDKTGSYSLGKSFIELFLQSEQAYGDYICEVMSRFWIKEIVNFNWNVTEYPALKVRKIQKLDALTIFQLAKAGLITGDAEVENALRREVKLPEKEDDETTPPKPKGNKPEKEKKNPDNIKKIIKKEGENSIYARINRKQSALQNIELTEIEKIPNLMSIETELDHATDTLEDELLEMKNLQVDDIIKQIIGGRKIQNLRVILKKEMYQISIKKYKEMIKEGKKEVIEELNTQGAKIKTAMQIDYEDLAGLTDDEIAILIEKGGDVLKTHLMIHALEERKRGVINNDELARSLKDASSDISDLHWKSIAATAVNGGWGAGRRLEAEDQSDDIEYAYYSAILDGKICPACLDTNSLADSQKHEAGDPRFTTPNPRCYSTKSTGQGNFCRCFEIYVYKQEREEPPFAAQRS
jgi:hypothetical protein